MNRRFLVVLVVCLAFVGLMVSCKNDIEISEEFGQELVSVTFAEASGASRGLSASLEDFEHNIENYYWGYAAKKSAKDTSEMRRGETPNYATSVVWLNVQNSEPAPGLPSTPIPGFSQGYWDFRLCAYKKVNVGTPSDPVYDYVLVYQGETKEFLLKSSSTNESGNNLVTVTVNPVSIIGQNGTLIIKTTGTDAIKLNTVDETVYGENYFPRVISVATLEAYPVEYVNTEAEIKVASYVKDDEEKQVDGLFSLPAGSYKITFVFSDSASSPTVNYAKGTIVATVYSNLETTIKGDLSEMTTSVTIQPELNPELVTYTAVSDYIQPKADPTTSITFSSTGVARKVEAKTTAAVTNKIIENMATDSGTTTGYNQQLKLNLNVETVEATETTATYEIGMTATLTSTSTTVPTDVKTSTSDVSSVAKYVTVTLGIQEGLTEVAAYHDGNEMMNLQGFNLGEGWTVVASIVNDVVSVKKVKSGEADVDITNLLDDVLDPFDTLNRGFFFYDDSGVIVFITRSFSPYSLSFVKPLPADFVAEVGGFKYVKLENAIKKAETSSKVTLLKNITLTSAVDFNVQGGILDLAGYTIAGNVTASNKGATVKNGTINGTLTAAGNSALIKDLTVTGKISIGGTGAELENCTVTGTGDYAVEVTAGNATIKSGTYKAADNQKILNGTILVEDGNFKGSTLAPANAPVSLIGGVYEYNVEAFVVDGYECANVSEGVYKVRKAYEAENTTTGAKYYYFNDAIDEASAGDEILLLKDIELTSTLHITKSLTIDGGSEKKTILATSENFNFASWEKKNTILIYGTENNQISVDLKNLNLSTAVRGIVYLDYADGVVTNVTAVSTGSCPIWAGNGDSHGTVSVVLNDCEMTDDNSVTTGDSTWARSGAAAMTGADLTINGGSYYGYYGIYIFSSGGRITVNEPEGKNTSITGINQAVRHDNSEFNFASQFVINGGSFNGPIYLQDEHPSNVSMIITGGTFTNVAFSGYFASCGGIITGGTFDADPSAYIPEIGYIVIHDEDEYIVRELRPTDEEAVAMVVRDELPNCFRTLDQAIGVAENEGTVRVLKNINLGSGYVSVGDKELTIEGVDEDITITSTAAQVILLEGSNDITVKDLSIAGNHGIQAGSDGNSYSGKLSLDNATITVASAKFGIRVYNQGEGFGIDIDDSILKRNLVDPWSMYNNDDSRGLSLGGSAANIPYTVTVDNSEILGFAYCLNIIRSNLTVTMTGGRTSGRAALNVWGSNCNCTLDGVEIRGNNYQAGPTEAFACIVTYDSTSNNTITVNNCSFIGVLNADIVSNPDNTATEQLCDIRGTNTTVYLKGSTTYSAYLGQAATEPYDDASRIGLVWKFDRYTQEKGNCIKFDSTAYNNLNKWIPEEMSESDTGDGYKTFTYVKNVNYAYRGYAFNELFAKDLIADGGTITVTGNVNMTKDVMIPSSVEELTFTVNSWNITGNGYHIDVPVGAVITSRKQGLDDIFRAYAIVDDTVQYSGYEIVVKNIGSKYLPNYTYTAQAIE